jgi:hypothetical protein
MADREYVNRFIAFTELDYTVDYKGNIDDYLRKALKKVNTYDEDELRRVEKTFYRVMGYSWKIFGENAFRKYSGKRRGPVNKALFESWSLILAEMPQKRGICCLLKIRRHISIRQVRACWGN